MKLLHYIAAKITSFVDNLADNDAGTVRRVIESEIQKGRNQLQELCIEEAKLVKHLAQAQTNLEMLKNKANQAEAALKEKMANLDESALKQNAAFVLKQHCLVNKQQNAIDNIYSTISNIRTMQTDLHIQITEAEMHLSEIAAGMVVIDAKQFKIGTSEAIDKYKAQLDGKNKYHEMTVPTSDIDDSALEQFIARLKS